MTTTNQPAPTLETDAATLTVEQRLRYLNGNSLCDMVHADFARKLERERDQLKHSLLAISKLPGDGIAQRIARAALQSK